MKCVLFLCGFLLLETCHSANIVAYMPLPFYSHQTTFKPLWLELAKKGHKITLIQSHVIVEDNENITHIQLNETYRIMNKGKLFDNLGKGQPIITVLTSVIKSLSETMEYQLTHPEVQDLLRGEKKVDLFFTEFLATFGLGLGRKLNASMIGLVSMDSSINGHVGAGNPTHPIMYPDRDMPFYPALNFKERVVDTFFWLAFKFLIYYILKPIQEEIFKKHLGVQTPLEDMAKEISLLLINANPLFNTVRPLGPKTINIAGGVHLLQPQPLPKLSQYRRLNRTTYKKPFGFVVAHLNLGGGLFKEQNVLEDLVDKHCVNVLYLSEHHQSNKIHFFCMNDYSVINHFARNSLAKKGVCIMGQKNLSFNKIAYNRSEYMTRNMCDRVQMKKETLKHSWTNYQDLQDYLDNAKYGVIYFSLGSSINSKQMPDITKKVILETFSRLPNKILWKFDEEIVGKSDNVKIMKWIPQQDVLRHKNVKLFITQGGLQSMEEAIFNYVPMIALPFYGDQLSNSRKMAAKGFGLTLDHKKLNVKTFHGAILEVLNNPRYRDTTKELADLVMDQPMTGLEKAVWWTEYVLRHGQTEYFRDPSVDTPWYQFLLLDVISFFLVAVAVAIYVFIKIVQLLKWFVCKLYNTLTKRKKTKIS